MIARIWHGYTTLLNADVYEELLIKEVIPEIEAKGIDGYEGFEVLRRDLDIEVEFTTIIWFRNSEAVKGFVGENYEEVYVPEKARAVLSRFDQKAVHHSLKFRSGSKT